MNFYFFLYDFTDLPRFDIFIIFTAAVYDSTATFTKQKNFKKTNTMGACQKS